MYTIDSKEAQAVESHIDRIFESRSVQSRAEAVGRLFVEELDFHPAARQLPLAKAHKGVTLPPVAHQVASLDSTHVVYVALNLPDSERVRKAEAAEAAKQISRQLGGYLLLVVTNTSCSQLHLIYPTFEGKRPTLRRMVAERYLPRRTAIQQIANIYQRKQETGSIHMALESAFDVEAVTKRFFSEYKRVFDAALDKVTGFGQSQDEKDAKRLFVQTLFNRLMFGYFLSRKGWLTFKGDRDYLNALWEDYLSQEEQSTFYTDRLDLLFFCGLNNPQSQDLNYNNEVIRNLIGSVPFLNGGLFEKTESDIRKGIVVPDDAIEPILTDLFDRFNFTVMESTPYDIEVAVDPEMLGKVFEELVTGRHESGSYYTPRPVVAFMCREALKGYLAGEDTGLSDEATAAFVDDHNTSDIDITAARRLAAGLNEVTVVDPACGSGAYLLGMMQELIELQTALYSEKLQADPHDLYTLKLQIIQSNLYGVDIDPFATNIAMLRLWLALAIEYEGGRPEPLPNLDFKIVCGDSLLGPDPDPSKSDDLFRNKAHNVAGELYVLKEAHMGATGARKDRLKEQIEELQNELRRVLADTLAGPDLIDWRVEFAEVFDRSGGFDIVVANPPYLRQESLTSQKTNLAHLYPDVYRGRADILVYFYARAIQLLRRDGVLAFITSNKYMRASYGDKLRRHLATFLSIVQIIDFGDLPLFTAAAYPSILVGKKDATQDSFPLRVADLATPVRRVLTIRGKSVTSETVNKTMDSLPQLLKDNGIQNYPQTLLHESGWILEDPRLISLSERLMDLGTPLGEFANGHIYRGVVTGLNKAFVIDQAKRDELITKDSRSAELIKSWLRGKDIKLWRTEWAGLYVIFANRSIEIDQYPAVKGHLSQFRSFLEQRATSHLHPWYELQQPQEGIYHQFTRPKIIWPDIAREVRFAYDMDEGYLGNTGYFMPTDSLWMLALMNSDLIEFLLCQITSSLRGGFVRLIFQYIIRLPIVVPESNLQLRLAAIAQSGVDGEPVDKDGLNDLVYWLYGLSENDVALVKGWFERRSLGTA